MTNDKTWQEIESEIRRDPDFERIRNEIRKKEPWPTPSSIRRYFVQDMINNTMHGIRAEGIPVIRSFHDALQTLLEVNEPHRNSPYENSPVFGAKNEVLAAHLAASKTEGGITSPEGIAILNKCAEHMNHYYGRHGVNIIAESIDRDVEMAQWEQNMHRESRRHVEAESGVTITFTTLKALQGDKDHTNLGNAQKDAGGIQTVVFRAKPGHFPDDIAERLMSSNAGIHAELSVKDGTQYLLVGTAPAGVDGMMRKSESSKNAEARNIVRTVLAEGLISAEEAAAAGVQAKQTHR